MSVSAPTERSWWIWVLAAVGAGGLLALAVVAALVTVPPVVANIRTQVASAQSPLVLEDNGARARVAVPSGWLVTRTDDATAVISTPDRGMTISASIALTSADAAARESGVVAPLVETLASGLVVAHGSPDAAEPGSQTAGVAPDLIAAVGPVDGGSVVFVVRSDDLPRYLPALAELIEGVAP